MLDAMLNIRALFPLVTWILPIVVGALIHNAVSKQPKTTERRLRIWLLWFLGAGVGWGGVTGFLEHWLLPDQMAQIIGFHTSFFQFEVAVANLVCGVLGFMSLFIRERHFWLATIVANTVWFLGDAAGHIYQYDVKGNAAPGNIGGPFLVDLLQPALLIILYIAWRRASERDEPGSAVRPIPPV